MLLAYHDRPTAACSSTLCEMMFASHVRRDVDVGRRRCRCPRCSTRSWARCCRSASPISPACRKRVRRQRARRRAASARPRRGQSRRASSHRRRQVLLDEVAASTLQRAWSETTHALQRLRDNPGCAQQEYDRILDAADPGLHAAPHVRSGRGHRGAVHRHGRAPGDRDPARAGRQRTDRDGGGVRPRRLRRRRRAHDRHHHRPAHRWPDSRASSPAAAFPTATCSARARAGRSRFCSTPARATSSARSSSATIRSRSACATAAR